MCMLCRNLVVCTCKCSCDISYIRTVNLLWLIDRMTACESIWSSDIWGTVFVCIWSTVLFPFLMKPLMSLGLKIFPNRSFYFFLDVVDKSVKERKTAADDEEVCVNSSVLYLNVLVNVQFRHFSVMLEVVTLKGLFAIRVSLIIFRL